MRGDEGGAERDLGLAEADVAADQPVHRPAGGEVVEHGVDRGVLVLGLLVGEARGELVVEALGRGQDRRLLHARARGDLDQRLGHLADALLEPRLPRLPADAAELVERDLGLLRAVARQELDVLDREIDPVAAGIDDLEAIVRRARRLDGAEAVEAADAVVDMDDEVALGEAGRLGDEVGGAALLLRPDEAVAEDVLLADDGDVAGLEAGLEAEHGDARPCRAAAPPPRASVATGLSRVSPWSTSTWPVRSREPSLQDATTTRFPSFCSAVDVADDGVEDVDVVGVALGGEGPAAAAAEVDDAGRLRLGEGRNAGERQGREALRPLAPGQVEVLRAERLVGHASRPCPALPCAWTRAW